jgi:hypothetical protein
MGEMIKMVVVLTILSVISGGGLKGLEEWAKPKIENNVMNLVKGTRHPWNPGSGRQRSGGRPIQDHRR